MSYASLEISQQDSAPVRLYQFNRGATTWRYVSLPTGVTALGYAWSSEIIGGGSIASTSDVPKDAIEVTFPITNTMASAFLAYSPDEVTTVSIWKTHYDDLTNGLLVWKGRILNASTSIATITLNCESVFTSLRRMGLREVYSRRCRRMLFEPGCNVDAASFAATYPVSAVSGNTVTLFYAELVSDIYVGGTLKASDGTKRMIIAKSSTSNVLTIMQPILALQQDFAAHPESCAVTLYPGCDRSTNTCRSRFSNLGNFGGFPGITGINPMSGVSSVF